MGRPRPDETAAAPMLRRFNELKGYGLSAADCDVGSVEDL